MGNQVVSILGCGWLGLPLGQRLVQRGLTVKGSTTQQDKIPLLRQEGITPYLLECAPQVTGLNLNDFFICDVLLIGVPFRRDLSNPSYYKDQVHGIMRWVLKARVPRVIFSSSTMVYSNNNGIVDEQSPLEVNDPRVRVLTEVEDQVRTAPGIEATILRFAGLVGPGREIGRLFLKGGRNRPGDTPVNLVHRDDCIGIMERLIVEDSGPGTFNVCADEHPLRKDLYARAAQKYGVAIPVMEKSAESYKMVSNTAIKNRLGYVFKYSNPMDMLSS